MSCHSTHVGIAATGYAKAITDLDDSQVSSLYHRLKREGAEAPAPTRDEAALALIRQRRAVAADPDLVEKTRDRLLRRYDAALADLNNGGDLPDGATWYAQDRMAATAIAAQAALTHTLREAARQQRVDPDRLAAKFRNWRRGARFEDIESPDPAFRPDPAAYPSDKATARALRKLGFENYLAQKLPCFVYGTLRKGQGNDRLMNGAIDERFHGATADGVAIYGANRGFPYAQESPDGAGTTVGDLVYLDEGQAGDWARQSLDNLEGFDSDSYSNSHYRRVARQVTYLDPVSGAPKTVTAWTYLAGRWAAADLVEADRIADGDWVRARDAYRSGGRPRAGAGATAGAAEDSEGPGYTVTKRATDPAPARSAADSAAVFAAAFETSGDEADEHARYLAEHAGPSSGW